MPLTTATTPGTSDASGNTADDNVSVVQPPAAAGTTAIRNLSDLMEQLDLRQPIPKLLPTRNVEGLAQNTFSSARRAAATQAFSHGLNGRSAAPHSTAHHHSSSSLGDGSFSSLRGFASLEAAGTTSSSAAAAPTTSSSFDTTTFSASSLSALFRQTRVMESYFVYLVHYGTAHERPDLAPLKLEHDEHQHLGVLFGTLDRNGDGFISADDIAEAAACVPHLVTMVQEQSTTQSHYGDVSSRSVTWRTQTAVASPRGSKRTGAEVALNATLANGPRHPAPHLLYPRSAFRKLDRHCIGRIDFESFLLAFFPNLTQRTLHILRKSLTKPMTKLWGTRELLSAPDLAEIERNFAVISAHEPSGAPVMVTLANGSCVRGCTLESYLSVVRDPECMDAARADFIAHDSDGDGVLLFDEFLEIMKQLYPPFRRVVGGGSTHANPSTASTEQSHNTVSGRRTSSTHAAPSCTEESKVTLPPIASVSLSARPMQRRATISQTATALVDPITARTRQLIGDLESQTSNVLPCVVPLSVSDAQARRRIAGGTRSKNSSVLAHIAEMRDASEKARMLLRHFAVDTAVDSTFM